MTKTSGYNAAESWPYVPASIMNSEAESKFRNCVLVTEIEPFEPLTQEYPTAEHVSVLKMSPECKGKNSLTQLGEFIRESHPKGPEDFSDQQQGVDRAFQTFFMWQGRMKIGLLPLNVFLNGVSFFTFRIHERLPPANPPLRPVVVHATFQYADESSYAYGKRERFREFGLWKIDPQSYYEGHYIEISDWNSTLLRIVDSYNRELERTSPELLAKVWECTYYGGVYFKFPLNESLGCFHPGRILVQFDDKKSLDEQMLRLKKGEESLKTSRDPAELHIRVQQELRLALRNAFALGRATNRYVAYNFSLLSPSHGKDADLFKSRPPCCRAVIIPQLWCFCARFWWLIYDCNLQRQRSIMSTVHRCPLDHNIMPGKIFPDKSEGSDSNAQVKKVAWDFREQGFLTNPKIPKHVLNSKATLTFSSSNNKPLQHDNSAVVVGEETIDSAIAALSQASLQEAHIVSISGEDLLRINNCGYSSKTKVPSDGLFFQRYCNEQPTGALSEFFIFENEILSGQNVEFNEEITKAFPASQHIKFCSAERNPQQFMSTYDTYFRSIGKNPGSELNKVMNCTGTDPIVGDGFISFGPPPTMGSVPVQ